MVSVVSPNHHDDDVYDDSIVDDDDAINYHLLMSGE